MNTARGFLKKYSYLILGLLFLAVALPRIIFPDLDHGDEFSDANALNAGENFVKFGFIKSKFLPIHQPHFDKPQEPYTHYPPLPDILNGLLRMAFKTDSLRFFRSLALVFSFLGLLFWFLFVKKLTHSFFLGMLAALFYLANPLFIYGMDALYEMAYSDFLRSFILFSFLVMAEAEGQRKKRWLILLWVLIIIETLITFEYVVYLSLFFVLYKVYFKKKGSVSWISLFVLATAPVIGFLVHFFQNVWYFGSFSLAYQDLRTIAVDRIILSKDAPSDQFNFFIWWKFVIARYFSLALIFDFFLIFLATFSSYLAYQKLSAQAKKGFSSLLRLLVILLACGISWYILFPAHAYAHTYIVFLVRHLIPVAALVFTLYSYVLFYFLKENTRFGIFQRIFLISIIGFILSAGLAKSELPITSERVKKAQDFLIFKQYLLKLREKSGEKDVIGVNYYRSPFMRYYTHRQFKTVFNKQALESLPALPQYFILLPYENESTKELLVSLREKYVPLFECNSGVFPSIFLELKK